jgi:UDP-N-acetylglucosamine/UDP-N-acetylgalactosamine diphosphorylase
LDHAYTPVTEWTIGGENRYAELGRQWMAQGACGCVLVAGGQGTRLGFAGPKGLFPVTVIKKKSLFQRICERVLAASEQVGCALPLAIMTSQDTDRSTREYLTQHHYFGLEEKQVEIFVQGSLPTLSEDGQTIGEGPDGNGAVFKHFVAAGIAQRWRERGIECVSFIQIDNALADPYDADFLGFHQHAHADATIKATWRDDPTENVGVIVRQSEKIQVVEYSEIDPLERQRRDADGQLVHRLANLSLFCFSMDFMQRMAQTPLPLHVAKKVVDGSQGKLLAQKSEYFVFDALAFAEKTAIFVVPRRHCFAALKNRAGPNSLATVQADLLAFDRYVYERLTGQQPDPTQPLELSAEFYYPTATVRSALKNHPLQSAGYLSLR